MLPEFKSLSTSLGSTLRDIWIFSRLTNINHLSVRLFLEMDKCHWGTCRAAFRYGAFSQGTASWRDIGIGLIFSKLCWDCIHPQGINWQGSMSVVIKTEKEQTVIITSHFKYRHPSTQPNTGRLYSRKQGWIDRNDDSTPTYKPLQHKRVSRKRGKFELNTSLKFLKRIKTKSH